LFFVLAGVAVVFGVKAVAGEADDSYQSARNCYNELKQDATAQKYRENWEKCIDQFETVSKKFRKSERGADALYSLGRLYEELAFNSKNQADWFRAKKMYASFATQHPRDTKADDAYFRMACIEWERFHDKAGAKKNLLRVMKFYKESDTAGRAAKYLESVEAGVVPVETVPEAAPAGKESPRVIAVGGREVKYVIVIDPGHGGADTGAIGPFGTHEKDVVLSISKKLALQIEKKMKNVRVYLTRNDDRTLELDDRVKFANAKKADIFVSIHANAAPSKKQSGVQTYFLNNATDEAAERLAAQENKNSNRKVSDLDKIIATMLQNASTEESRVLAEKVHLNLVNGLTRKYTGISDKKVRSALFYVLVGVKCPSVLVETSYVSNPKEEKRLGSEKYQSLIAESISDGIIQHLRTAGGVAINI